MLFRATQRSEEGELALIRTAQCSDGGELRLFGGLRSSERAGLRLIRTAQLFVGGVLCSEEGEQRLSGGGLRSKEPLLSSDGALLGPNEEEHWLEEPDQSSMEGLLCSEEPEQSPAGGRYCTQVN